MQKTDHIKIEKIGIVGLGLIGTSLAMCFCESFCVLGVDPNPDSAQYCTENNFVNRMTDVEGLKGCDVIFVCTPLKTLKQTIRSVYAAVGDTAVLSDVGSVKGQLSGLPGRLVGGHPMAGTEKSGARAARRRLFEKALYCLVRYPATADADVALIEQLVQVYLKAQPIRLSAEVHDREAARLSHLPHMAAYTLASSALAISDGAIAGPGFLDTTRIAASDPSFWAQVALLNQDNLLLEMDAFIQRFQRLRNLIASGDDALIEAFLAEGKQKRDGLNARRARLSRFTLWVDVPDEVGSIGRVSTLLADKGINLSNIAIMPSREESGGALLLEFEDENDYQNAKAFLSDLSKIL